MKKKSVEKNYIYNIIYEVFALLAPLITTPYISRVIGADGIGVNSFTFSNASYFVLFASLGSTVYARREVAFLQDDKPKRSVLFWEIVAFRAIMTTICLSLYIVYCIIIGNSLIVYIQAIYIIAVVFDVTWLYQGMEDFGSVVIRNTIIKIIGIICIFLFVKSSNDLVIYILCLSIPPFIGNIFLWFKLKSFIDICSIKDLKPLKHFKGSIVLFIPTIASQVYLLLDKTMIGIFTIDNLENGYYEQAQKIIRICWTFVTTFATVMAPRIAYIFSNKDSKLLQSHMRKSYRIIWLISIPIMFGILAITDNLVPWFFGAGYEPVNDLLYIFCIIVVPIGINSVTGSQYLISTKRHKWYTLSIIFGAIANLLLNLFLIPRHYSIGAAIASVVAEFIIALTQVIYVCVILKEIKLSDIFYKAYVYLCAGIVMFLIVKMISANLESRFVNTMICVLIGSAVYCLVLVVFRDDLLFDMLKRLKIVKKRD